LYWPRKKYEVVPMTTAKNGINPHPKKNKNPGIEKEFILINDNELKVDSILIIESL
jgi:hypothetical protein